MINKFKKPLTAFLIIFLLSTGYSLGEEGAKELLERGKQLYKEEKFEEAMAQWKEILTLTPPADRYHKRAKDLIERAQKEKIKKEREEAERKREEEEKVRLLEVEEAWLRPKRPEKKRVEVKEEVPKVKRELEERAKRPVSLDFEKAHLRDVLNYLAEASDVSIVLDEAVFPAGEEMELEGVSPRVTIHLKDIPLIEALDVIVRMKGLKYRLEENIIWITTPENLAKEEMVMRTFSLRAGAGNIEEILKEAIPWPEGSNLRVDVERGNVIAHNTPTNLKLVEDTVQALDIPPTQILVEAKIVEIFVDELKELALTLGDSVTPNDIPGLAGREVTGDLMINHVDTDFDQHYGRWLGTLADFAGEGLSLTYTSPAAAADFTITVTALEKMGKARILSTPSVISLNQEEAIIRLIQGRRYLTGMAVEEETTPIPADPDNSGRTDLIDIETDSEDVGVTLTVTPSVGADMKVITLTLKPELIQLIGEDIIVRQRTATTAGWYTEITVPIFFRRTIQSRLMVGDGESVLLGGLIREEKMKDETKVPILGDIPLLGKFFRRDTTSSQKRNLFILITCHILTPTGEKLRG